MVRSSNALRVSPRVALAIGLTAVAAASRLQAQSSVSEPGLLAVVEESLGNAPGDEAHKIVFSRGEAHVAWISITKPSGPAKVSGGRPRDLLTIDGRVAEEADEFGPFVFSPQGRRLMYSVRDGDEWRVVVDDQAGPGWKGVGQLVFSADGSHWAYRGTAAADVQHVVTDGFFGRPFEWVGKLTYSADGRHFAHVAVDGRAHYRQLVKARRKLHLPTSTWQKNRRQYVVVDGADGELFPSTEQLAFSPQGRRLAYVVLDKGRQYCVVDGQPLAAFDGVGRPTFSGDGAHLLHGAMRDGKSFAVVDGAAGPRFETIAEPGPVFGPHDARVGFVAKRDDEWVAVVDGIAGAPWEQIGERSFSLSADGYRFAYAVRRGVEWRVVVNASAGDAFEAIADGTPLFSPDGRRIAYAAIREGRWHVIVDGAVSEPFDDVGEGTPLFSLDGEHLIHTAATDGGWRLVIDGRMSEPFEKILGVPMATSRGVEFFGVRDGALLRCSAKF